MEARVHIKSVDAVEAQPFPELSGIVASDAVSTRTVMANPKGLYLAVHALPPGAQMTFKAPPVDHLLYVWKGGLVVDGSAVGDDQVVVVEHGAAATLQAGPDGATLAHFYQSEEIPLMTQRAGGHVHIAPREGLFARADEARKATHTVWVDAHCPTCELWLHRSTFAVERAQGEPHIHNEDEIIFIVDGGIKVGQIHGPGTAISVAAGAAYTFGVGPGGGAFINFRPTNPLVKMLHRGAPIGDWVSERSFMLGELDVPVIDPRAQLPAS